MKKIWMALLLVVLALGLAACGETEEPVADPNEQATEAEEPTGTQTINGVPLDQYLAETYPLESKKVIIFANIDGDLFYKPVVTVTDPIDIQALIDSVDFASWEGLADPADGYAGINYYYVHFNDDCIIGMYDDIAYGDIGRASLENASYVTDDMITDREGCFNMPEGFLTTVQAMVEKYGSPSA